MKLLDYIKESEENKDIKNEYLWNDCFAFNKPKGYCQWSGHSYEGDIYIDDLEEDIIDYNMVISDVELIKVSEWNVDNFSEIVDMKLEDANYHSDSSMIYSCLSAIQNNIEDKYLLRKVLMDACDGIIRSI